jgi:hypothetical protein
MERRRTVKVDRFRIADQSYTPKTDGDNVLPNTYQIEEGNPH